MGHIPVEEFSSGDITRIKRLMLSKEGEPLLRLLGLSERKAVNNLRNAKEIPLYQAQGVAQFLEEFDQLLKIGANYE